MKHSILSYGLMKMIILISIMFVLGCEINQSNGDHEHYVSTLPEGNVEFHEISNVKTGIPVPDKVLVDSTGNVLVIDYSTWSMYLVNMEGNVLDTAGSEGRGPYEFLSMNGSRVYETENVLQIYDGRSQRVTYFNISENELQPAGLLNLPKFPYGLYMKDLYKLEGNYYGLFKANMNLLDIENSEVLQLYSLNSDLSVDTLLMKFEGDEQVKMSLGDTEILVENPFGFTTEWAFSDSLFVVSNTRNMAFTCFNLVTNEVDIFELTEIPEIRKTNSVIDFFNENYSEILTFNKNYGKDLQDRKIMPYFSNMGVVNQKLIISLNNYDFDEKTVLLADKNTGMVKKIKVPSDFYMHGVTENLIYGVRRSRKSDVEYISLIELE